MANLQSLLTWLALGLPLGTASTNFGLVAWGDAIYKDGKPGLHVTLAKFHLFSSILSSNVTAVFSNGQAFAALKLGGEVVTWGIDDLGGDSYVVADKLRSNVTMIFSIEGAFAALKLGGEVVTWGKAEKDTWVWHSAFGSSKKLDGEVVKSGDAKDGFGSSSAADNKLGEKVVTSGDAKDGWDSFPVTDNLGGGEAVASLRSDVTTIFSTDGAFAALKRGGQVIAWGDTNQGGDPASVEDKLRSDVTTIFSTDGAFAALKRCGKVVTWGAANQGGDSSSVADKLRSDVTTIFSTGYSFAALKRGGEVATWGDADYGGDSSSVADKLHSNVTTIFHFQNGFAALKMKGEVVSWSHAEYPNSLGDKLRSNVTNIFSTVDAYAALSLDGEVVTWGGANQGGDSYSVADKLRSDVTTIFSTGGAFAALKRFGRVVAWGAANQGGDSSSVADKLRSDVTTIFSTEGAFAALKRGGEVVTWGNAFFGGDSSAVAHLVQSRVQSIVATYQIFIALVCIPTHQNIVQTGCGPCPSDKIWKDLLCQPCSHVAQVPDETQSECIFCDHGSIPNYPERSGCTLCPGNTYAEENSLQCKPCFNGQISSSNKTSCSPCSAGRAPDVESVACTPCRNAEYAEEGFPACRRCPIGQVPSYDKSSCSPCAAGRAPDKKGVACAPCDDADYAMEGSRWCKGCPVGQVPSGEKDSCRPCEAGHAPDAKSVACAPCEDAEYAEAGFKACRRCPIGQVPSYDKGSCQPCEAGRVPDKKGVACHPCQGAEYAESYSPACARCPIGQVPTLDKAKCYPCSVGHAPDVQGVACAPCKDREYAEAGFPTCKRCPSGQVPNHERSQCLNCNSDQIAAADGSCQQCMILYGPTSDQSDCSLASEMTVIQVLYVLLVAFLTKLVIWNGNRHFLVTDISLKDSRIILTTLKAHKLYCSSLRRSSFPITLCETSHPDLDTSKNCKPKVCRAKVESIDKLELLDAEGNSVKERFDTSKGKMSLTYLSIILHSSWPISGFPSVISASMTFLTAVVIAAINFNSIQAAILTAAALLISCVACALMRRRSALTNKTPLQTLLETYAKKLSCTNPRPRACPKGPGRAISLENLLDMYHFFQPLIQDRAAYYLDGNILRPLTAKHKLSFAELVGPDLADYFVSHSWGDAFAHFCTSIQKHAESSNVAEHRLSSTKSGLSSHARRTAYWICFCSNNQYDIDNELGAGVGWQESSFYLALQSSSCRSSCIVLDDKAMPLTRSWCIFETLQALKLSKTRKDFELLMCTESDVLNWGGASIDAALGIVNRLAHMNLHDARASKAADKEMIDELVMLEMGSFAKLNQLIRDDVHEILQQARRKCSTDFDHLFHVLDAAKNQDAEMVTGEQAEEKIEVTAL